MHLHDAICNAICTKGEPFRYHCCLQVLEVRMRDTRSMTGTSAAIQSHLAAAEDRLGTALRAVLFRSAPSARR